MKIDLVLTAHPTEVKRRTIIQKYTKVNNVIDKFSNENNLKTETKLLNHYLYEEITSIWKTDEIKRTRPTSVEEAKWGLAVIEDSLWDAVPKICSRLNKIVQQYTKKALPTKYSPITFGSWMGGDRAAKLYEKELTKLIQDLSMHECSQNLINKVGKSPEPYRVYLRPIRNKMKSTQKEIELHLNGKKPLNNRNMVQSINEVINPLNEVYDSLCSVNCDVIANGVVEAVKELGVKVPVVVRLEGTNANEAQTILEDSGVSIITAKGMKDAAEKVVSAALGS